MLVKRMADNSKVSKHDTRGRAKMTELASAEQTMAGKHGGSASSDNGSSLAHDIANINAILTKMSHELEDLKEIKKTTVFI